METYQRCKEPKQVVSNTADSFLLYTPSAALIVSDPNKNRSLKIYIGCTNHGTVFLQSHTTPCDITVVACSINAKWQLSLSLPIKVLI